MGAARHERAKYLAGKRNHVKAVGYVRTSSATNVGADKDSEPRQRRAIQRFAKSAGYGVVDWFYDADAKGSDPIESRPGFAALLNRIEGACASCLSRMPSGSPAI
jgi:DNA invertase Pin-like site-specific DNA recombinase